MKILEFDKKRLRLRLVPESVEDLYYLTYIINKGDILYAWTKRTLKIERSYRKERGEKIKVYLGIKVENLEFSEFVNRLRVKGIVVDAPDYLPIKGQYHTIIIEVGKEFYLEKQELFEFQLEILEERSKKVSNVMIISIGEESSLIGLLRLNGFLTIAEINRTTTKDEKTFSLKKIYEPYLREVFSYALRIIDKYSVDTILILHTSIIKPWLSDMVKNMHINKKVKNIRFIVVSEGGISGIYEFMRRNDIMKILKEARLSFEITQVNEVYDRLLRDDKKLVLGLEEVKFATELGAIDKLIITDTLMRKALDDDELRNLIKNIEKQQGKIIIVKENTEHGLKLKSLGGIVAITRFNVRDLMVS